MTTLEGRFEDKLREAVLANAERRVRADVLPALEQTANDLLSAYGTRHDYDVQPIIQASTTEVTRQGDRIVGRVGWPEPAIYFERGTVAHTVQAQSADVLSFVWVDPPQWVREQYEREGDGYRVFLPEVQVDGLPEAAFIRDALNALRRRLT